MFQPYEWAIGLRYLRAKRRNHFISFISLISTSGIALGVAALITVLSVMNGFEEELRERILGMAAHATITEGPHPLDAWEVVAASALEQGEGVVGAAPYVQGEAMLRGRARMSGTLIRGVLPEREPAVSDVGQHMLSGELAALKPGEYQILLGSELAASLGVLTGDKVDVLIPQASVTPVGIVPRFRRCTVAGVFEVGMYEYDRGMALMHLQDASTLYGLGEGVTGVRLKLQDMFNSQRVARQLTERLPGEYRVRDWTREHANFFKAIRTEKVVMFIILSLIVAVAAFNIVSTLVMVVTDKQSDIAILRTLGASPASVRRIFMVQGAFIGVVGTLLGVIGGVLLAANVDVIVPLLERLLGHDLLSAEVYYIHDLRGVIEWADVGRIALMSLLLGLLSTIYPSWRASRVQPAEALRYE